MSISPTALARVAGLGAVAAGALFIAVQINHPPLDVAFVGTTEFAIRQSMKIAMAVFALVGITGMYLSQVRKAGVLGLVGYLVFGAGYLAMFSVEVIGLVVLPAIASTSPGYVSDIVAVATGGSATGSIGLLGSLNLVAGFGYLLGGLVFGIALARAHVLARWASILLAVATTITMAIPLLPWINQRLFAIPTGVALIGLGYSLWRQRTPVEVGTTIDALATAVR
ncbi:hypothetical protein [Propionicimonas sp.]|uniref:hypothetical protein n=1 Tax=Propionicimonas sp. TaxID=1955623 RepID=UPI0017A6C3DF|nr:hypothetical protein [Propionicimonas sp.]MBU3976099.1 hypothetical protein [Actinomycetota bacterium]MBA3020912.1 hypothetical protein [Propionicimonas sp.]MBU3985289.1 hypothetical protein [Actinomycetota bacterium]MBU4008279.1 hypothetical protein [Actinomycetota bacterium]MBU4064507.1 hypothetical protein [Actinomycetota bacterium]